MLNHPPKKLGGGEVYENNTATTMSCDVVLEQENSRKTIPDWLGKMEIPDIVQMEKETNQDKEVPLSWNDDLGDPSMRSRHEDKKNEPRNNYSRKGTRDRLHSYRDNSSIYLSL